MKLLSIACLATALLGYAAGVAASPTIVLNDGSRIQGDIQSLDNGVYSVRSPSLGVVRVPQSNIARIVYGGEAASDAADAPAKRGPSEEGLARELQQLESQLAQDPATMQSIMSLQSDPQIQAVLNDPVIAKAIQEGDYMTLLGNAKIQGLEGNAHVQQILRQVR